MNQENRLIISEEGTHIIRLMLFSVLRETVGSSCISVVVGTDFSGKDLLDFLAREYRIVETYRPYIRLAVNEIYVPESVELSDGDEVALITPVSGG